MPNEELQELSHKWPDFRSTRDPVEVATMTIAEQALANSRDLLAQKLEHVLWVSVEAYNLQVRAQRADGKKWSNAAKLGIFLAVTASNALVSIAINVLSKS